MILKNNVTDTIIWALAAIVGVGVAGNAADKYLNKNNDKNDDNIK